MKIHSDKKRSSLPKIAICMALGLMMAAGFTNMARADRDHDRGQDWRHDHDWDHHADHAHHDWDRWHGHPYPGYVYAPPVIYSPPPVEQSSGFSLILPIHFN